MGAQFTPGPWGIDEQANSYSPPSLVIAKEGTVLAEVFGEDHIDEGDKANAHLIAAAPELYEALDAIMNERWRPEGRSEDVSDKARADLAKARGQ